ncbi:MAG TPA: hypothetical protein VM900_12865 [Sphingomonas sp.]|jgi:hypothetical protein|nr:hypothetical protein [Sphingomonas sp.]
MNAWPFITAAYVLTLGASAVVAVAAQVAMWRAERAADKNRRS